ncbi:unnamed protein product [Arabidopsis halleri]
MPSRVQEELSCCQDWFHVVLGFSMERVQIMICCASFIIIGRLCIEMTPSSKTTLLPDELCMRCGICVKTVIKPRHVGNIKKLVQGNLGKMLEKLGERGMLGQICADLDLDPVLDHRAKDVSSRELQRFVIATVFLKKVGIYIFDEPSSFLDVRQKLKAAHVISSLLGPDSRLWKLGRMTTMSDLPRDLVEEILSRVPLTSLNAVRSTCKTWNALSKTLVFGKAAAVKKQLFMGFIMMDYRVCSMKFHLQNEGGDLVVPCIKQVGILNQVEISKVLQCDGLLLCVTKDISSLVVWNPYLGQTRWIQPRNNFHKLDNYALGYDKNRNHKILRVFCVSESGLGVFGYEIYSLSSNSWKVFDATPDWDIHFFEPVVSLKGNTYFLAQTKTRGRRDILLPFDFTMEKFGQPLPMPFESNKRDSFVSLSCVREEHLAVLHQGWKLIHTLEIWVTNKIDLGSVSWTKFLTSTSGCRVHPLGGSFFIDEEKKVAVVFDVDAQYYEVKTHCNQTANIIGQDGYFKSLNIGEAPNLGKLNMFGRITPKYCRPLVCSSYVPSLVHLQINQPPLTRKEVDDYY